MSNLVLRLLLFFSFFLLADPSFGQLTIEAEIRPRAEFRWGFKTLRGEGDAPAFFIEQRSRLYSRYQADKLELNITLQDVRIWGSNNQIYKSDNALTNLYEAWARYYFSENWSVKVGRQAIDLDNARFLGDLDWAQQGRSHDALLLIYQNESKNMRLHTGGAFNQNVSEPTEFFGAEYLGINNYKTMQFVWFHKSYDRSKFSLLFHNDGRQVPADTSMAFRQTFGAIADKAFGKVQVNGEFYYQSGKDMFDIDVSAFLLSLTATYTTLLTPLTVGFDYLSGSDAFAGKDGSFDPLYGTNHKFYGFMDYFYVGNPHGQGSLSAGLLDVYLKGNLKFTNRSALLTHLHYFSSASKIYDPDDTSEELSKTLGPELDVVFVHKIGSYGMFYLGYSALVPTESLQVLKNRGNHDLVQHWAWAMLTFKPVLFTTKKE